MPESGLIYGTFIDPLLNSMRKRISGLIDPNLSIIDIACGTGAQAIEFARFSKKVTGIDLSESMIRYGKEKALKNNLKNTEFFVFDATDLSIFPDNSFDLASLSLALHQLPPMFYSSVINEMRRVSKKLLVFDYAVPLPGNLAGVVSRIAEFLAGKEHLDNFKSYNKSGGLKKILESHQIKIEKSVLLGQKAFELVICKPDNL